MVIKRDFYLNRLIDAKGDGFVKIVTGIRRCGKSYLLFNLFKRHLLSCGVERANIVQIELDKKKDAALRQPDALYRHIGNRLKGRKGTVYVFIDEIQECKRPKPGVKETDEERKAREQEFYDILNEFRSKRNVDLYVTGSNSRLLVEDVATQFRGRGETIRVNPLTFSEYYSAVKGDKSDAWNDYLLYGGMPEVLTKRTPAAKKDYLESLFTTIYFRDIVERDDLPDDVFLGNVTDALMSVSGSLTNPTKLAKHMGSILGRKPDPHTVRKYIDLLSNAYLFKKAERFDIRGREYLDFPSKYYPADIGLRNARLNFRQVEVDHLMECAIYNELVARGANVDVGVIEIQESVDGKRVKKQLEIDFIVNLGTKKIYIQSAYQMPTTEKLHQEVRGLKRIKDSFRKIVVVGDPQPMYTDDCGITYVGLMAFMLDKSILEKVA